MNLGGGRVIYLDHVRNVRYNIFVMQELKLSVTNLRKDLFNVIDQVVAGDVTVLISKDNDYPQVVLTKLNSKHLSSSIDSNLQIIKQTNGVIKTAGYKSNEMDLAKEKFIEKFSK